MLLIVLISYSDVLVAMQDSQAGLVLQQRQIQNKDYNNCFTGLHFSPFFGLVLRQLTSHGIKTTTVLHLSKWH